MVLQSIKPHYPKPLFSPMINLLTELRVAGLNLRRNKNRTAVAALTIVGGLLAYLLAGGFIEWIFDNMRESTIRSQLGHIQIIRPNYFEKGIADPYNFLLPSNTDELDNISKNPDVEMVTQRLAFSGLASRGDITVNFLGEGIDPSRESVISNQIHIREGKNLENNGEHSALLGEGLAKNLAAKIGDKIVILVTAANGAPNAIEVTVAGTFFTATKEFDDSALRLPIALTQKLMRVSGSTSWVVLLRNTEHTTRVVSDLRLLFPTNSFEVVPWVDLADFYKKTVALFGTQLSLMKAIIALIIVLTISNTQTMSILERTTEIGTMMAIGARRLVVLRMFVLEGFLLGIIGGVSGVALGYILSALISILGGIPMPPAPGMETGFTAQILLTPTLSINAFELAVFTTLLASAIPSWRASRMNVVDALRCNQ